MSEKKLTDHEIMILLEKKSSSGWALTLEEYEFFKAHETEFGKFIGNWFAREKLRRLRAGLP